MMISHHYLTTIGHLVDKRSQTFICEQEKVSMGRFVKVRVVQALTALMALFLCTVTAFAQPLTQTTATQVQACGHWDEAITITIPADRRVSIGRVAELVAEDASNQQFNAGLLVPARTLPFERTNTRPPRSMHATSLSALVAGIYTGGDANVRTTLVARLRAIIQRAGMNYVSIEEKRLCCLSRSSTGERICQAPTGMACEGGSLPRLVSRNRYVRPGFRDDFLTESFVAGDAFDRSSWRGTRGYDFRVFIKPGRRPFVMNIERVYDAAHHPRPAAALCRELPLLAAAPPPTDAASKESVFRRMAELTAATIAEGDLTATIWATRVVSDVGVRIADLEALGRAEQVIANRDHRLRTRWEELQHVRTVLARADALKARWQKITTAALVLSLLAIMASIFIGVRTHRKTVKREIANFLKSLESELFEWTQFAHSSGSEAELVLGLEPSNIGEQLFKSGRFLEFLRLVRSKTQGALEIARKDAGAYSRVVLDIVGQDNMATILNLSTARSENSGSITVGGSPLTPLRARDLLKDLVRHFWEADEKCANLRQTVKDKDDQLRGLVKDAHAAVGATTLAEMRRRIEDAVVTALTSEAPTLKRDPTPKG